MLLKCILLKNKLNNVYIITSFFTELFFINLINQLKITKITKIQNHSLPQVENSLRVHRDDVTALPRHQSPPQPAPWQRRGRFLAGADRVRNGSVRLGRSGPHPAQPPLPRPEPRLLQFHLHAAVLIRGIFFNSNVQCPVV